MGGPKALLRGDDGTAWVVRAAGDLQAAGCDPVRVVVGAAAAEVTAVLAGELAGPVEVVVAADWSQGMGASLRAGLDGLGLLAPDAQAVLVHLVDLPDVRADALARVARLAAPDVLARASYAGRPGHPVLLGSHHWAAVAAGARGDAGARDYLTEREVQSVDCGDLASGVDVDTP
jgi:CTP:molybdopterin cytidylyltransferase MocA